MITRPLDLASRLRPEPRNFDYLFLVNGGFIVLFFFLFGSRFVLAPGLGVDFTLPELPGAKASAALTTHVISVKRSGQIFVPDGMINLTQLRVWLEREAKTRPEPSLLVRAEVGVSMGDSTEITRLAQEAGFRVSFAVEEMSKAAQVPR